MKKAKPIWLELPENFKITLVKYLDLESSCSLQICSKSEYELVQKIPVQLEIFTIYSEKKCSMDGSTYEIEEDQLGQICARIFKNPKSRIREIYFDFTTEKCPRISYFNPNFKIKASILSWKDSKELGEEFLRILKYFDSKYLEMLKLGPEISREFLDQICKTEQWKCAQKLEATGNFDTRIDWFMHFEQITVRKMYFLSVEKAVEIVKSFQNRNLPIGSFFKTCTEFPIMVDTVLTHFSERNYNQKDLLLPLPDKNHSLKVHLDLKEFSGEIIFSESF